MRTFLVALLATAALGLTHPARAEACPVTPLGGGMFACNLHDALDPACPSFADGATQYLYFLNIPLWAQGPTFSGSGPNGAFPANSPCPNSTLGGFTGTDFAPGGSPGADERSFEIDFTITPNGSATGGQTPAIDLHVNYTGKPAACIDPPDGHFTQTTVGNDATLRYTVTNCGHAPLVIDHVEQVGGAGAFAIKANLCDGATIPPGGSCTFDVDFTPTAPGARTATIKVIDNAGDSPQSFIVDGTGIPAPGGGGATACPTKPSIGRPCADVYIDRFTQVGIRQHGDHQDAIVEIVIGNRGPDNAVGVLEVTTQALGLPPGPPVRVSYDIAPGGSFVQEAGAHIAGDEPFSLKVNLIPTTPDPNPGDTGPRIATFRPPTSTVQKASGGGLSGIAHALGDLLGLFAAPSGPRDVVTRVQVAVLRVGATKGACRWLRDASGHYRIVKADKTGRCKPTVWLRAKGTGHWSYRFRHKLPPGRYIAFSRAFDTAGLHSFGTPRGRAFRVR